MKQGPLFQRQFFVQRSEPGTGTTEGSGAVHYIRLHGHAMNPAKVLNEQKILLGAGGMLDVVSDRHGGEGIGRVSYTPGLKAAIKRGEDQITYRFEVPASCAPGSKFQVTAFGHDQVPPFQFVIEVGARS